MAQPGMSSTLLNDVEILQETQEISNGASSRTCALHVRYKYYEHRFDILPPRSAEMPCPGSSIGLKIYLLLKEQPALNLAKEKASSERAPAKSRVMHVTVPGPPLQPS